MGSISSATSSSESASVLVSACMPPMISVMDCAMNTAPMTSSMNVMGTATTTSLPLMISSVESVSGALPRFSLRSSMTPLDCVDLCWPELAETLRSSMLPTCVATSPESTCGSMEPAELGGQTADAPPLDLLGADERIAARIDDPDGCLPLGGAAADERHEYVEESLAAQRASIEPPMICPLEIRSLILIAAKICGETTV